MAANYPTGGFDEVADEAVIREVLKSCGHENVSRAALDDIIRMAGTMAHDMNRSGATTATAGSQPLPTRADAPPGYGLGEDDDIGEEGEYDAEERQEGEDEDDMLDDEDELIRGGDTGYEEDEEGEGDFGAHHRFQHPPQGQTVRDTRRRHLQASREAAYNTQPAGSGEAPHLRRFELYEQLERDVLHPPRQGGGHPQQPSAARHGVHHRGDQENIHPSSVKLVQPHLAVLTKKEKEDLKKDLFLRTGNKAHRDGPLVVNRTRKPLPLRRHADPVAAGQRMRDRWQRDPFLAQKGRTEERWRVRLSMLQ